MRELSKSAATDLELVHAIKGKVKKDSEKAFNTLYKKYHDSMLYHFKGMIKDDELARELVLEAFAKVSANIEKFSEESSVFSTWLFKLTQNLFIDKMRKKKEEVVRLSDLAVYDGENHIIEYEIPSLDRTPEADLLIVERNKKIKDIVDSMSNKELSIIVKLRFYDNLSYDEIAEITEKPLNTIKAFLHRAKKILKEEFEKQKIIS